MSLETFVMLPESAIPLDDPLFLRGRQFSTESLRKPFIARLRTLLEKYRITIASLDAAASYRQILLEEVFSSSSSLLPFFSLHGGDDMLRKKWAQLVLDNLDIASLLDNIAPGAKEDTGQKAKEETLDATEPEMSPLKPSAVLSQSSLSDVTFTPKGDFTVADWVTMTVAALAKPALLATFYVQHVRMPPEDACEQTVLIS
jgi:hypothetical protein